MTFSVSHVIKMEHRRRCLKFILLYFLNFIIVKSVTLEFRPYDIIWNAPTTDCKSRFGVNVDPTPFGIRENDQNGLIGNVITLLYVDNTGLYPYYTSNGTAVNGGLPQVFFAFCISLSNASFVPSIYWWLRVTSLVTDRKGKVMFSEASISHSVLGAWVQTQGGLPNPPIGRPRWMQTPLEADPWMQTPQF